MAEREPKSKKPRLEDEKRLLLPQLLLLLARPLLLLRLLLLLLLLPLPLPHRCRLQPDHRTAFSRHCQCMCMLTGVDFAARIGAGRGATCVTS